METKCADYQVSADEIARECKRLLTAENVPVGLSEIEALSRLKAQSMRKSDNKEMPIWKMIFNIVTEPINLLMIAVSVSSAIIYSISREEKEHITACIFTFSILVISMVIEIYHHLKLKGLVGLNAPAYYCNVFRDRVLRRIRKEDVVKGDLVKLSKGDKAWVDCVLIKGGKLEVDESAMSGKKDLVKKESGVPSKHYDKSNMIYDGSIVISGSGLAIVISTGQETLLHRTYSSTIPECASSKKNLLSNDIEVFFNASFVLATILAVIFLIAGIFLVITPIQLSGVIVSVYISVLPEGIPTLVKLLSYTASLKLRTRNVLVSDMDAVQRLAEVTMICISKNALISEGSLLSEMIYNGEKMIGIDSAFYDRNENELEYLSATASMWLLFGEHICGPLPSDALAGKLQDSNRNAYYDAFKAGARHNKAKNEQRRKRASKSKVLCDSWGPNETVEIGHASRLFGEVCHVYFGLDAPNIDKSRVILVKGHYSIILDNGKYNTLYVFGTPKTLLKCCRTHIKRGAFERLNKDKCRRMNEYFNQFEEAGYTLVGAAKATLSKRTTDFERCKLTFISYMCMKEVVKNDAPMTLGLLHAAGISNCIVHGGNERSVRSISDELLESIDYPYDDNTAKIKNDNEELGKDHLDYFPGSQNLEGQDEDKNRLPSARMGMQIEKNSKEPIRNRFISKRNTEPSTENEGGTKQENGFFDAGIGRINCYSPGNHLFEEVTESGTLVRSFLCSDVDKFERAKLVDNLRKSGQVVAYFGAHASDKEAMMHADVAIAADNAPEICKDAASLLLPADSIIGIIYSMEEGRLFYVNLQKAIKYVMMHISPQIFALSTFLFLGTPLPISPILLFFLDYLVEVIPAMFFAYEDPEYNLITSGPKCLCTSRHCVAQGVRTEPDGLWGYVLGYAAQIRRVVGNGTLYSTEVLQSSILVAGLISAMSCTIGFFTALMICGVPFSKCFFVSHEYFRACSPPLTIGTNHVLNSDEQLHILYRAQATFFVGILICQACNILMCRRSVSYISTRFFDNAILLATFITGMGITIACICVKWFDDFLLVRRPVVSALVAPTCGGILILLLDTYKKLRIRLYK